MLRSQTDPHTDTPLPRAPVEISARLARSPISRLVSARLGGAVDDHVRQHGRGAQCHRLAARHLHHTHHEQGRRGVRVAAVDGGPAKIREPKRAAYAKHPLTLLGRKIVARPRSRFFRDLSGYPFRCRNPCVPPCIPCFFQGSPQFPCSPFQ